jgi:hypothetical protein
MTYGKILIIGKQPVSYLQTMIRVCLEYDTDVSHKTCTIQQIYRLGEDV